MDVHNRHSTAFLDISLDTLDTIRGHPSGLRLMAGLLGTLTGVSAPSDPTTERPRQAAVLDRHPL